MNSIYSEQVRLLLRILPILYKERDFAILGGTAINLFVKDMPRYSIDIDLTYIPLEERESSLQNINDKLLIISENIKRAIPFVKIKIVPDKLLCMLVASTVKIEVNGIKRGLIGDTEDMTLCQRAQQEFEMFCRARVVSLTQLYGGKIGAALSRQHPRDLFDYKYMTINSFESIRHGLIFNILSSQKSVLELLSPNPISQMQALENQFRGMTDLPFTYNDYELTRQALILFVNSNLTNDDKEFLISFESANPKWENSVYHFAHYPSIKWKLMNLSKLKENNPTKHKQGIDKLREYLKIN
jgi:predicted nucleotidyltransferase component of viral defense system